MEVALILGLGDVAATLGYAATGYQPNNCGSHSGSNTSKSHPSIHSSHAIDAKVTRTHSGIYCNPAFKQRRLPPVAEIQSSDSESSGSNDAHSEPSSPRSASACGSEIDKLPPVAESQSSDWESNGSDDAHSEPSSPHSASACGSEIDSPPPTSRLALPNPAFTQLSKKSLASKYLLSFDSDCPSHSPCTAKPLMPTLEKCTSKSMRIQTQENDEAMSSKISAGCGYLLPLTVKNVSVASNSTCGNKLEEVLTLSSTCSDLDTSDSLSTASFNVSNTSEQQSRELLCCADARDIEGHAKAPVSKARLFCQQVFAECELDNLEGEMADVTKELEALRVSMASSKRSLCA